MTVTNNLANFGTGTSTQVLTSNGEGSAPSFQTAPVAGAWIKLQTQTASSSATIAFSNTYINNANYKIYAIVFDNVTSSASGVSAMNLLISANNGSSYIATGYFSGVQYLEYNATSFGNANSTTSMLLMIGAKNNPVNGTLWLFLQGSTTAVIGDFFVQNAYWEKCFGSIFGASDTTNNIQLAFDDSANISTGTFTLYGLAQ